MSQLRQRLGHVDFALGYFLMFPISSAMSKFPSLRRFSSNLTRL